ncbi:hypothetical protein [Kordiimonas sp.]|uniref:hypothetical protein n=1 Tax=Kordiimonas sp. TaxID=1970157 RepID=UPI003A8D52D9
MPQFPSPGEISELRTLRTWLATSGDTYVNTADLVPTALEFGLIDSFGDARAANQKFLRIRGDKTDTDVDTSTMTNIGNGPGPDFLLDVTINGDHASAFAGADGNALVNGANVPARLALDPFYLPLFSDGLSVQDFSWNHVTGKGSDHYYLGLLEMSDIPGLAIPSGNKTQQERMTESLQIFLTAVEALPADDPVLVAFVWSNTGDVRYLVRTVQPGHNGAPPTVTITVPIAPPNGYFKLLPDPLDAAAFDNLFA